MMFLKCVRLNVQFQSTYNQTNTHIAISQPYIESRLIALWLLSIYSRVHLGESKLIEVHHNGLFISHWVDRHTPSFALSHSALTSLPLSREVKSGWSRNLYGLTVGNLGSLRAFRI